MYTTNANWPNAAMQNQNAAAPRSAGAARRCQKFARGASRAAVGTVAVAIVFTASPRRCRRAVSVQQRRRKKRCCDERRRGGDELRQAPTDGASERVDIAECADQSPRAL